MRPFSRGLFVSFFSAAALVLFTTTALVLAPAQGSERVVPVPSGRRLIVSVGINEYQAWRDLDNAVSDAEGFLTTLVERFGYETLAPPLLNEAATQDALMALVKDQLPQMVKPDDTVVVFYAGHGATQTPPPGSPSAAPTGYLVPADAPREEQWSRYVPLDEFLEAIALLPARHVLVILDACYSGVVLGAAVEKTRSSERYTADLMRQRSRRIITSARASQRALDGGFQNHSLFTGTLIEGLISGRADYDKNSVVTASELSLYVEQQVAQTSNAQQTPDYGAFQFDERGELIFPINEGARAQSLSQAMQLRVLGKTDQFMASFSADLASRRDPRARYLKYLHALQSRNHLAAVDNITALQEDGFEPGLLPLPDGDIPRIADKLNRGLEGHLLRASVYPPKSIQVQFIAPGPALQAQILAQGVQTADRRMLYDFLARWDGTSAAAEAAGMFVQDISPGDIVQWRPNVPYTLSFQLKPAAGADLVYLQGLLIPVDGSLQEYRIGAGGIAGRQRWSTPWREHTEPVGAEEHRIYASADPAFRMRIEGSSKLQGSIRAPEPSPLSLEEFTFFIRIGWGSD